MEGIKAKAESKTEAKIISIDDKIADVLKYDSEGWVLSFDTSPGKFRKLVPEVWKELSNFNKQRYIMAESVAKIEADYNADDEWKSNIDVLGDAGTATSKLELQNTDLKNFAYYSASPANMGALAGQGYEVAPDATFAGSGTNKLTKLGQVELVAMRIPKAKKAKLTEARKLMNRTRRAAAANKPSLIDAGANELGRTEFTK